MFLFYDSAGKIISGASGGPHDEPPPHEGTPIYLDDVQYANVWNDQSEYKIQNGVPVYSPIPDTTKLVDAQKAKIVELRKGYAQTVAGGFNITIGTTQYTFGWSTDDKTNLLATQEAITDGYMTFPVQYADIQGSPVSIPDQATLSSIKSKATSFFSAQHQQVLNLIGQINSSTTVSDVEAITWTPATY